MTTLSSQPDHPKVLKLAPTPLLHHQNLGQARRQDIRVRALMPMADQGTSTTHQARSSEVWPTSHTTTTSTATKARSISWNKNTRHNSANIILRIISAHLPSIANLHMAMTSSDNQMTLYHQTSVSKPWAPSTQISRQIHASTWKEKKNAHLVMAAHSITMKKRRGISLTHFPICLKVSLFRPWMRRLDITIRVDITIITIRITARITSHSPQSAHSNSALWTNSPHPSSKSPASSKWPP